jgi:CheY-like chemotaxis protein
MQTESPAIIMIVDDEPDDIALLRRRLRDAAIDGQLMTFTDAAEALTYLRGLEGKPEAAAKRPTIMFLDLQMPKVHGFVLLKWVRSQSWLDETHLIVLSGSDKPEDRERSMKLGADCYLVKFPAAEVLSDCILHPHGSPRREVRK